MAKRDFEKSDSFNGKMQANEFSNSVENGAAKTVDEASTENPRHEVATSPTKHPPRPPGRRPLEGGWGWACVFGCAFVHFLSPGLVKSFGITIVYIMEQFQCTSSQVSF